MKLVVSEDEKVAECTLSSLCCCRLLVFVCLLTYTAKSNAFGFKSLPLAFGRFNLSKPPSVLGFSVLKAVNKSAFGWTESSFY